MKYISIILMLLFASACQTPTKKGKKFTWQDNTSTQERTVASAYEDSARPGEFIMLRNQWGWNVNRGGHYYMEHLDKYCDSNKSFVYTNDANLLLCVKK